MPFFVIFLNKKIIHIQTVANFYLKFAQVEGVVSVPIWASKTKKSLKNAKIKLKKNFYWLNKKLDLEWTTMSELEKPFLKKSDQNFFKKLNLSQNTACEQDTANEKWKFGSNKN